MSKYEQGFMHGNCNYICITGKIRGCDVENCDKYINGKRKEEKDWCVENQNMET